jgi:hypothetical protein
LYNPGFTCAPKPPSTAQSNCPDQQSNLKNWNDNSTWPNGQIPSTLGQALTLPANTKVMVGFKNCHAATGVCYHPLHISIDVTGESESSGIGGSLDAKNCHPRFDLEPTDPDPKNCKSPDKQYGDDAAPCGYKEITRFGGHVIIVLGVTRKGYIEGVEFYRMGQTYVIGQYPMHFHLLGENCANCYLRDLTFHHSFYRCMSVHGTNAVKVLENVAYDITGYCYYLEDGVEERKQSEL